MDIWNWVWLFGAALLIYTHLFGSSSETTDSRTGYFTEERFDILSAVVIRAILYLSDW